MAGVYGAGVLKRIDELGFSDRIECIYAGSAGALDAAYFLSGQHDLGSRIYWEDLQYNFIFPRNILWGTYDLVINRYIRALGNDEVRNVLAIDYVCSVVKDMKPLDFKALSLNRINLYVKLLDIESGEIKYIKAQDKCCIDLFHAAINAKPYYFPDTYINGRSYIDGTIKEPIGIKTIEKLHPGKKIIIILNGPVRLGIRHYMKSFLEGLVAGLYPMPVSLRKIFFERDESFRRDIEYCRDKQSISIISPTAAGRAVVRTTDPETLKHTFSMGLEDANVLSSFLR